MSVVVSSVGVMVDLGCDGGGGRGAAGVGLPSVGEVRSWRARLAGDGAGLDDAARIELLRALEELKCAAEGAQAAVTVELEDSQRAAAARAGVPAGRRGRGVGAQVALARRESPHRGQRHLGLARVLHREMPCTRAALRAGRISEWKATLMVRETACLSLEHRLLVDRELAGDAARLEAMGERELVAAVQARACRLEPAAVARRRRRAHAERHTTLRPAPDTMSWFGALLPVKDGVAVHAVLGRVADRLARGGDPRTRGQIMADTLVTRVLAAEPTTQPAARPTSGASPGPTAAPSPGSLPGSGAGSGASPSLPVMVNLVVCDQVLLGDGDGAGQVAGYGPVPGDLLRAWIADTLADGVEVWVRRLYAQPGTGRLVAMDSRARRFEGHLADYLRLRDRTCRTPWCDAPIRHLDHPEDHAHGGPTTAENGQGLCEACNHAKQAPGWTARPRPGPRHTIETTTPTGHRYTSVAPDPGVAPAPPEPPRPAPAPQIDLIFDRPLDYAA